MIVTDDVLDARFWEAMEAYRDAFGEYFPTEEGNLSYERMISEMWRCVAKRRAYRFWLPPGAVS